MTLTNCFDSGYDDKLLFCSSQTVSMGFLILTILSVSWFCLMISHEHYPLEGIGLGS
jgi:hypothetical protein